MAVKVGSTNTAVVLQPNRGLTGKSAYEIAVQNGFVGTETQWLNSLKATGGSCSAAISVENGNRLEMKPDGLFVSPSQDLGTFN